MVPDEALTLRRVLRTCDERLDQVWHEANDARIAVRGAIEDLPGPVEVGCRCVDVPARQCDEAGQSVGAASRFYKIEASRIFAFHDELDLPAGKLRVRPWESCNQHREAPRSPGGGWEHEKQNYTS